MNSKSFSNAIQDVLDLPSIEDGVDYLRNVSQMLERATLNSPLQKIKVEAPFVGGRKNKSKQTEATPPNRSVHKNSFDVFYSDTEDEGSESSDTDASTEWARCPQPVSSRRRNVQGHKTIVPHPFALQNQPTSIKKSKRNLRREKNAAAQEAHDYSDEKTNLMVYVEIISVLGELLAQLAQQCGNQRLWLKGAEFFKESCEWLYRGIHLLLDAAHKGWGQTDAEKEQQLTMSEVIFVAADSAREERDSFLHKAKWRLRKLAEDLKVQEAKRLAAKERMGEAAWRAGAGGGGCGSIFNDGGTIKLSKHAQLRDDTVQEISELQDAMLLLDNENFAAVAELAGSLRRC
jgi:hypothetical protein